MNAGIGIGIVGCGLIGHKRAVNMPPRARLVACHDIDPRRAESFGNQFGVDVAATLDDLVKRDDIQLVIVATVHDAWSHAKPPERGRRATNALSSTGMSQKAVCSSANARSTSPKSDRTRSMRWLP